MALAHLAERVVVAALAVEVDGDQRPHAGAGRAALGDRAVEQRGIDRPRRLVGVDEERRRARVDDRVRARGEGEVRAGDLVARADPEHDQREVQRGGPARQRDRVLDARDRGELASNASTCGPSGAIQFDAIASATSSASRPATCGGER